MVGSTFHGLNLSQPWKSTFGLLTKKDPLMDMVSDKLKASCSRHEEGPTLECATREDLLKNCKTLKEFEGPEEIKDN